VVAGRRIEFRGVSFGYFDGTSVFRDLDLVLGPGLTLLLGPNGSGKSSLLKLAAGVEKPDAGSVLVNGDDLWVREVDARRDLAYVPEHPDVTPYASVAAVMRWVARLRGVPPDHGRQALDLLGLAGLGRRSIRQLSKGQRHRVLLAAARVGGPQTLVLDEPLDGLDRGLREATLEWIRGVCAEGGLALVATHDLEPFAAAATGVVAVLAGRVTGLSSLSTDPAERLARFEVLARGGS